MWLDRTYRILVVLSSRGDVWLCQSGERNWCDVLHSLKWESRSTRKKLLRFQEMAGASGKAIFLRKCNGEFCFWEPLRKGLVDSEHVIEVSNSQWSGNKALILNIRTVNTVPSCLNPFQSHLCIWEVVGFHYRTLLRSCPHFPFTYCVWFVETVSYQVEKYMVHLWVYTNSFPCFS